MKLKAGPFNLLYEKGFLRNISYGENEIIRMIYFALRDENWRTYDLFIEDEKIIHSDDHFSIRYTAFNRKESRNIVKWTTHIEGTAAGEIRFDIKGEVLENVLKNRAGLCVLHPVKALAGSLSKITHTDGSISSSRFPEYVAPFNPFKNIGAMQWDCNGHKYNLAFQGETFETEDQRNWTDASYKTFCTPLDKPFPVQLLKGDEVCQCVTFAPEAPLGYLKDTSQLIEISLTGIKVALPVIGIGASTEVNHLGAKAIEALRKLPLNHYRIEVAPNNDQWIDRFTMDCENANKLGLPLEIAISLTLDFKNELNQLSALANKLKVNVNKILLLSQDKLVTDQHVINFTPLMRSSWPGVKIGAGTNYNFTELNRNRFDAGVMDFISFSIHPQEHAFDNQSLIENIEGQSEVVKSLHQLYPDKSIHISPLTLRKRFNPYSTDPGAKIITNEERADPRQKVQFGSLFTMGSIKALSEAKVDAITLFQTAGNQGVVSEEGNPYPVYTLLHELRDKPYHFIGTKSSNTLKAEAILLEWQGIRKLILMNYTHENLALQMDNIVYELLPSSVLIKLIK